jgi:hypothetical protein
MENTFTAAARTVITALRGNGSGNTVVLFISKYQLVFLQKLSRRESGRDISD